MIRLTSKIDKKLERKGFKMLILDDKSTNFNRKKALEFGNNQKDNYGIIIINENKFRFNLYNIWAR